MISRTTVGFLAANFLIFAVAAYFSLNQEIFIIILLALFFTSGVYLVHSSMRFIYKGKKKTAKVLKYEIVSSDGNADGLNIKMRYYTFTLMEDKKVLNIKSNVKSKFTYEKDQDVIVIFICETKELISFNDLLLRLFSGLILFYLSIRYFFMGV